MEKVCETFCPAVFKLPSDYSLSQFQEEINEQREKETQIKELVQITFFQLQNFVRNLQKQNPNQLLFE